jgi:hypothetical protein
MRTYEDLWSTCAQLTRAELRDLALRPLELTAQAQAALADELSSRDVPTENDDDPSIPQTSTPPRAASWYKGWLIVFQIWVTLQIVLVVAAFSQLRPGLGWSTLIMLATVAVPSIGLVLIANKSLSARRFCLAVLAVSLVARITTDAIFGQFGWRTLFGMAIIVAWYLYWLNSTRVAAEFSGASWPASPADA